MAVTLTTYGNFVAGTTPVAEGGVAVIDSSGGSQVTTLPAASGVPVGYSFTVVRSGANAVTIAGAGSDTASGDTTLGTDGDVVQVMKVASTTWRILSSGAAAPAAAIADLTFGTNIAAATANGSLTDSSATNPTDAQFNELAKELGTKVNGILAALRAASVVAAA